MLDEMQRATDESDRRAAAKAMKKAKKAAKKAAAAKSAALNGNSGSNANNAAKDTAAAADSASNNKSAANGKDTGATADNDSNANNADKDNGKRTGDPAANGNNAAIDTGNTDVDPATLPPDARGARAVANAIARHPEVDLDVALENHHATAGIPKENLTHEQIYDAITAEANFQKRQAIIQSRMRAAAPDDSADDGDPPTARSP